MTHPDQGLVEEALAKFPDEASNYRVANDIGVSEPTVRRWRDGDIAVPLRSGTRRALQRFLGRTPQREEGGPLEELIGNLDGLARQFGDMGRSEAAQARKLAALEGIERTATALRKELPNRFYEIRRKVERGEL